jgi:capsular polysaccharide biosynthesis protein
MSPTLARYSALLVARWRWVVWGILSALLVATVALVITPPVYRSEATVFVRTPGDVTRVQDGGDLFARARVETYAALAKGTGVSTRVVNDLGYHLTPEEFSRRIEAKSRPNTALLDLAVEAPSAGEAQRGLTVLISELESTVRALEAVPGAVVPRAELVVVDPPGSAHRVVAWGLPVVKVLIGVVLLGALLGALGAVLRASACSTSDQVFEAGKTADEGAGIVAGRLADTARSRDPVLDAQANASRVVPAPPNAAFVVVAEHNVGRHRRARRRLSP